jgi:hypothetical protein
MIYGDSYINEEALPPHPGSPLGKKGRCGMALELAFLKAGGGGNHEGKKPQGHES